jgi:hypothetical protein
VSNQENPGSCEDMGQRSQAPGAQKKKRAETKITRKPGSSRGSSSIPRLKPLNAKVSFKKLFNMALTIANAKPYINTAAKK